MLRRIFDRARGQRGQVLVAAVGVFALGLAAIAISVDAGWWLRDKRDAQNDADAVALAAAQELPDRASAETSGDSWAVSNGIDPDTDMGVPECSDGQLGGSGSRYCFIDSNGDLVDDTVRVKVSRPSNSFIAEALGVSSPTLNPPAAATLLRAYGGCVLPWAIDAVDERPDAYDTAWGILDAQKGLDTLFIFQSDTFAGQDGSSGNFGALGIYGANDRDYTDSIVNECGSRGEGACDSDSQVVTPDDLLKCDIQTGQLGKTTDKALRLRVEKYGESSPYADCDARSYADATAKAQRCLGRLVLLAIIKDFPSGGFGVVEIYGIANFFIAGWDRCPPFNNGDCTGKPPITNKGIVWGYILKGELGGSPSWKFDFSKPSLNPFAPMIVVLSE